MKIIFYITICFSFLYSNDFSTNNKIKLEYDYFNNNDFKINHSNTLSYINKIKYKSHLQIQTSTGG